MWNLDWTNDYINGFLEASSHEFVTSPRCSAVGVKLIHHIVINNNNGFSMTDQHFHRVVYVATGVKIRDMVEAIREVEREANSRGSFGHCKSLVGELVWNDGSDAAWIHTTEWDENFGSFQN